jgi:MFS transporter, ACS family, aldohexuronate transporter
MNELPRGRWLLCWLLFFATALNFLDRQVLSVLAKPLRDEFGMSNTVYSYVVFAFVLTYTVMFTAGGRLMDWLGARLGMALSVGVWSLASGAHALATGALGLGIARFFLGIGEGGCFPAATKGAVEWFPIEKRGLAIGIANGGSAFGAVIAPPVTVALASSFGWRGAFLTTGFLGLLWLGAWLLACRWVAAGAAPASTPRRSEPVRIASLLGDRRVSWVLAARFLFDPVFYFYMFWIPQYLTAERGFSQERIGQNLWIPFLVLGLSTVISGRLSDLLVSAGWAPRQARGILMTVAALMTPVSWLASQAPSPQWAIALMSCFMLAHGLWISNFLGLLSDVFPSRAIATITGLSGTAGGIGGMLFNLAVGRLVDRYSYTPAFVFTGLVYPVALMLLFLGGILGKSRPASEDSTGP